MGRNRLVSTVLIGNRSCRKPEQENLIVRNEMGTNCNTRSLRVPYVFHPNVPVHDVPVHHAQKDPNVVAG
jgi:hypothetical protein